MYNLITIAGGAVYLALLITGAVIAARRSGSPAARDHRWHRAAAIWTVALVLGLVLALTSAVVSHWLAALQWVLNVSVASAVIVFSDRARRRRWLTRIRMGPPTSLHEYRTRFDINIAVTWSKAPIATVHLPCPWCAAADFAVFDVAPGTSGAGDMIAALGTHRTCAECGRGGRFLIHHAEPIHFRYGYQLVQTLGDPPPAWLNASHHHRPDTARTTRRTR